MIWPWLTLAVLGAWHGVNPAMGWLFAVSWGLQERDGRAVLRALPAIALGHGLAIALVLVVFAIAHVALPVSALRIVIGIPVIVFGVLKLVRHRHPRWVGMRVGFAGLTWWSFLMASAHGAGLMLLPLFAAGASHAAGHQHAHGLPPGDPATYLAATAIHTGAMIAIAGAVALVVYHKLGLALLRRAWLNTDALWAVTLIVSGAVILVV